MNYDSKSDEIFNGEEESCQEDAVLEDAALPTAERDDGVITELQDLGPDAVLMLKKMCSIFRCSEDAISSRIRRGELPRPFKQSNRPCWLAGRILDHFRCLHDEAEKMAERERQRLQQMNRSGVRSRMTQTSYN